MAVRYIIPEAQPIFTAIDTGRAVIGEQNYQSVRSKFSWGYSAFNAFLPFNPLLLPAHIGLFIVFLLIFIYVFGMSGGKSTVAAWLFQGIVIMYYFQKYTDFSLSFAYGL